MMIEFVGQSAKDAENEAANSGRLINCYREPVGAGGKTRFALQSVPGMTNGATVPGVFMRALATIGGVTYAACGGTFYRIPVSGAAVPLGAIADSDATTISGHDGYVTIVAGGNYYVWDGSTLTMPTPGAFSSFGSVDAEGSYSILTELNGKRFQWSDLADPTDLPGTNFASATQRDDDLVRGFVVGGLVWLFGTASIELWTITGEAGASAFGFMAGGVHDVGLKSYRLVTKFDAGAFFVGDDNIVYLTAGTGLQPVSTPAVATAIEGGEPVSCFTYEARGHKFCGISFRDRPAWVYDISTAEWHERAEGVYLDPWRVVATAKNGTTWIAARDDGQIATLGDTNADTDSPLVREFVSRTVYSDAARFRVQELEFFARKGFGAVSAAVSLSGDDGLTWGKERVVSFGNVGDYGIRSVLKALGQFRQLTVRVRVTDPTHVPVYSDNRLAVA